MSGPLRRSALPARAGQVRAAGLLLFVAGCGNHLIHPAKVRPGPAVQIAFAHLRVEHEPTSSPRSPATLNEFTPFTSSQGVALLNFGWGWRFNENLALQTSVGGGLESAPLLSAYFQCSAQASTRVWV